ncbi:MAG: RpiB/LacA/LacB family sugar-phosphate isomerase [bacterium]|nr:RpiB/LacA/LacB family sugar-phosphate isomerase [bacterium]
MIFLGSDHAGFETKDIIKEMLHQIEMPFEDMGPESFVPGDDYTDYAQKVAVRVAKGFGDGILICDTGIGMDMAANKVRGVRASLCFNVLMAQRAKEHNNANLLVLGSELVSPAELNEIVRVWMDTKFSQDARHIRRLKKMQMIERVLRVDDLGA